MKKPSMAHYVRLLLSLLLLAAACSDGNNNSAPTITIPDSTLEKIYSSVDSAIVVRINDSNLEYSTAAIELIYEERALDISLSCEEQLCALTPAPEQLPDGTLDLTVRATDQEKASSSLPFSIEADFSAPNIAKLEPEEYAFIRLLQQPLKLSVSDAHPAEDIEGWAVQLNGRDFVGEIAYEENTLTFIAAAEWIDGPAQLAITASDALGNSQPVIIDYEVRLDPVIALPAASVVQGEAPLTVTFTPYVQTKFAINIYEWDFDGDGLVDTAETVGLNQNYIFNTPGTYKSTLKVTDSQATPATGTVTINVLNGPPVVSSIVDATNGRVPFTVNYDVTATDFEGVERYEWDFDGDGQVDDTTATGKISHVFETEGTYQSQVTVYDVLGAATISRSPLLDIRVVTEEDPLVTLRVANSTRIVTAKVPYEARFNSIARLAASDEVALIQWDFDNDGTIDTEGIEPRISHTYNTPGIYYPKVIVQTTSGKTAIDVKSLILDINIPITIEENTIFYEAENEAKIKTSLPAPTEMTLVIESSTQQVIKVLVPWGARAAGDYTDTWDGRNDSGESLPSGPYYAVLRYRDYAQEMHDIDLRAVSGGEISNPQRSTIPSSFQSYKNDPLVVDFTLQDPAEITAFMGLFNTNTRLITFLNRRGLGSGTHSVVWNGLADDGTEILANQRDPFLFGIWAYDYANNVVFIANEVSVSDIQITPSILMPTNAGQSDKKVSNISFVLSAPASVELLITDVESGSEIKRTITSALDAGEHILSWDATNDLGKRVLAGKYRIGLRAIAGLGNSTPFEFRVQRVLY